MEFTKENTLAMKGIAILTTLFHHCFIVKERWATVPLEQVANQKNLEFFSVSFEPFSEQMIVYIASFLRIYAAMFMFFIGYEMMESYI